MASREPIRQRQRIEQGRPRVVPPIARVRAEQYRVPSDVEGPQLRQGNIAAGGIVAPYLDDQYDRRHHQREAGDTNRRRREATTGRRADCRLQARVDARRRSISRRKRSMARARFPSHRWAEPARISSEHRPSVNSVRPQLCARPRRATHGCGLEGRTSGSGCQKTSRGHRSVEGPVPRRPWLIDCLGYDSTYAGLTDMRMTFLGHVGFLLETRGGSILCDPWFTPAYFGSWFPFPRNDTLDSATLSTPEYLYISHLHRDHFDPDWLARHVDKSTQVLLPAFGVPFLERELRALGFERFVHTRQGEPVDLDGCTVTIVALTQPADGPLGDSFIVVDDDAARVLNQNDARPGHPELLRGLGPFDAQIVQFSGAIWYPITYDFPPELKALSGRDKRVNEMSRARKYIEWVGAAQVFPCAGPPGFVDDDLFAMNDFDRDPANIFPDQTVFLDVLAAAGVDSGELLVPGTVVELDGGECKITQPVPENQLRRPFMNK